MPEADRDRAPAVFERLQRIPFAHCDPAGIVFYPKYFELFNGLVEDWITDELCIPYAELIGARRVGLPMVRLETDFKAVSRIGDLVTLALSVQKVGGSSLTLRLVCRSGDEDRVSARQVIVTTDLRTHRATRIPQDLRSAIERFVARSRSPASRGTTP